MSPAPLETEAHRQVRQAVRHNVSTEVVNEVLRLEAEEKRVAETVWAKEMLAQECGRTIERLWDAINTATNKLEVLNGFAFEEIQSGDWKKPEELPHEIRFYRSVGAGHVLSYSDWRSMVARWLSEGWALEQIEFRHNRFDVTEKNEPSHSRFYFAANLINASRNVRVSIEGDIDVRWGPKDEEGFYSVAKVDASHLTLKARRGEPLFKLVRDDEIVPEGQSRHIDPLIVYDLNGDGLSEIILAGRNLVYRNHGDFRFTTEQLCRFPEEYIGTALMADVNGDGMVDFISAKWEGLFVSFGSPGGVFDTRARLAWKPLVPFQKAMVITAGDIDADGDLDLFVGQYKDPYDEGVLPRPFYDANDGHPAYLLVNNGVGTFLDKTKEAGLTAKRMRRTFSSSFVDLDGDYDRDLLVVSDFAGADVHRNDGRGRFEDVTSTWLKERHAFGMSHSFADFNNDGLLDFLMVGMTSPTLERLNHLGLERSKDPKERTLEVAMTYGNRLFFGKASGGFEQKGMSDAIARAGWAWGSSAFDFDNDGFVDVYVANGFRSEKTVADSEGDLWLHDRFLESIFGATATDLYFKSAGSRTKGSIRSFGGHERNRLYQNLGGTNFLEMGYLAGSALPQDSRNVVVDDLDSDGKLDLLVTTDEGWPKRKQSLKILKNTCDASGQWIRLNPGTPNPVGEKQAANRGGEVSPIRVYVTGDGFRSQSPAILHFGLGSSAVAVPMVLSHKGARTTNLLEVNKLHAVKAPLEKATKSVQ